MDYIPFEKPLSELEIKIAELKRTAITQAIDLTEEINELVGQANDLRSQMFRSLTPYETTQISRHPRRPNTLEIIYGICDKFVELHGDRNFFDDNAIVCGIASFKEQSLVIIGHQKGRSTKENILRNFGMPKPEGYRKALRIMSMAERFRIPILTLIDTPGAYPGVGAEERGQSEAIGKNIMVMAGLKVPVVTIVIGEGGSGGALALGVGNRVHMMQYATYSVISPEGCASILMKDPSQAPASANALKLTAESALKLKLIDSIIPEPSGGGHRDPSQVTSKIAATLQADLLELGKLSPDELVNSRMERYLNIGYYHEN